ncbi:MAG: hypothetical protein C4520_13035 [Candidatus Abyssobacteria bacterium SURF_5]|uniref:Uncharacterized protein n=1 Tax=Abyssobacteria bacterium (strain SURF_5) TaxID=2093360 RepID=A0A3A4NJN1_ABYX5|nr:MAG: hypothetical protein C4520_13035 [Candidatus Abyssubacteria bacterium SURF_5]
MEKSPLCNAKIIHTERKSKKALYSLNYSDQCGFSKTYQQKVGLFHRLINILWKEEFPVCCICNPDAARRREDFLTPEDQDEGPRSRRLWNKTSGYKEVITYSATSVKAEKTRPTRSGG